MLKLKLQCFRHLMWRADSREKTLMLGKIEGRRKRGPQRWKHGVLTTGPPRNSRKSLHSARNPLHPFPMPLTSLLLGNNILKLTWHLPVQFCIVFYLGIYSFTIYRTTLCIKHFYMGNLTLYTSIQGMLQARILEWATVPFSRWSSLTRDRTWVFHIAGRFFTIWAIRETIL